jgi:hypothetical protein
VLSGIGSVQIWPLALDIKTYCFFYDYRLHTITDGDSVLEANNNEYLLLYVKYSK